VCTEVPALVFSTVRWYRNSGKNGEASRARVAVAVHSEAQSRKQKVKTHDAYITYITSICVSTNKPTYEASTIIYKFYNVLGGVGRSLVA
jgi:hypothetical protein